MGIVVISAGTSVPDALSSVSVAKNGQGDMAVSNVLGSNVFNIFLGLGLPWLLYSAIEGKPYTSSALRGDVVWPVIILFVYILLLVRTPAARPRTLCPLEPSPQPSPFILTRVSLARGRSYSR